MAITKFEKQGFVMHGRVVQRIDELVDSMKLFAVDRNGTKVIMRYDTPPATELVVVTARSGLRKTPVFEHTGLVRFETSLNPKIRPGAQVSIRDDDGAPFSEPLFRMDTVEHRGDTQASGPWVSVGQGYPPKVPIAWS
jgi:hypothetical protein